jgi:hypothetical protein
MGSLAPLDAERGVGGAGVRAHLGRSLARHQGAGEVGGDADACKEDARECIRKHDELTGS